MSLYDISLIKLDKGYGAMQKKNRNKRCISKEGMPHASACQKKRERKKKIAPYPKERKREMVHTKEFHIPST